MTSNKNRNACRTAGFECQKYSEAISNYVVDEDIGMPKEQFLKHLKSCPNCIAKLRQLRATYSILRARETDASPEVKKRSAGFIKELVNRPLGWTFAPDEKVYFLPEEVGKKAGDAWHYLGEHGKTSFDKLAEHLRVKVENIHEIVGWLGKEDKVIKSERKGVKYACLNQVEQYRYYINNLPEIEPELRD